MDKQLQITKQQYQALLDRANKRFGKLRELQTRGDHSWSVAQAAFNKTFDSFSRLWQFQLTNRPALLETGLQRCELGGIASKIGQLYYNYYLRSGDTAALLESHTFYDAIHTRQYFAAAPAPTTARPAGTGGMGNAGAGAGAGAGCVSRPGCDASAAAAAREMRFYVRFIVVCLFLNRKEEAMQLLQELQASVSAYQLQSGAPDAHDWQAVVNEVTGLMAADVAMPLPRCPGSTEQPFRPQLRCRPTGPAAQCAPHRPRLREALLVSYRPRQIRVAELPLELYRMAQALEWQDTRLGGGAAAAAGGQQQQQDKAALTHGSQGETQPPLQSPSDTSTTSTGRSGSGPAPSVPASSIPPCSPPPRTPPRQLLHRPTAQQLLTALLAATAPAQQAPAAAAGCPPAASGGAAASTAAGGGAEDLVLLYIAADAAPLPPPAAAAGPAAAAAPPPPAADCAPGAPSPASSVAAGAEAVPVPAPAPAPAAAGCEADASSSFPTTVAAAGAPAAAPREAEAAAAAPALHQPALAPPPPARQHRPLLLCPPAAPPARTSPHTHAHAHAHGPSHHTDAGTHVSQGAQGTAGAAGCCPPAPPPPPCPPDGLLWPEELLSGSRRRLLLLVDSDCSADFARLQGQERGPFPLLALLSPCRTPPGWPPLADAGGRVGSLATMALACPAQALCVVCGEPDPAPATLQRLQDVLDAELLRLGRAMAEQLAAGAGAAGAGAAGANAAGTAGPGAAGAVAGLRPSAAAPFAAWSPVFQDALTRRLLLHFAFYRCFMSMLPAVTAAAAAASAAPGGGASSSSSSSCGGGLLPSCFPPLPPAADAASEALRQGVLRAAEVLGRRAVFEGPGGAAGGAAPREG